MPSSSTEGPRFKHPVSVLVIIHTPDLQILLLERADHPGYWQSVTGSQEPGETLLQTAVREIKEETGLNSNHYPLIDWQMSNQYTIYPEWRWRYAPNITHNTEHIFSLVLPEICPIYIAVREHLGYCWLPWQEAESKVFSPSNAQAIRMIACRQAPSDKG
ncbi:dihydroneopterin triphosphate diphosphatase [Nitrosomonas mobilis]|uniref:dATP pyrophosphohydrolase n=1 Tax=Nitrosomonas mobilis TaxID=51642 RepID=A0A1G5SIZ8_9PROT|nr:dihydroneopterin triphosphate diphosphatase [Nitrosomonas mobilis]SCZ86339.1 dATP pyrophosphohydrolase [Nitrosomonas mobilis]